MYDVIIVGAGTAGLSAAIYVRRAGKTVLLLEAASYGGQIINSLEVENYPGIKHTTGYAFATNMFEQAKDLGAEVIYDQVKNVLALEDRKQVVGVNDTYECKAVILATGVKSRKLGVSDEARFIGAGVSYCATCDGAFFRGKAVAVVGGGNTALEDALFLSNNCSNVYIVHRRDTFRGENHLVQVLSQRENVEWVLNSQVEQLQGDFALEHVTVVNKDGERRVLDVSGLFVAIGQIPSNQEFSEYVDLDEGGFIVANETCRTKTPWIFVAGDCRTKDVRQLATAAADGAVAGLSAVAFCK